MDMVGIQGKERVQEDISVVVDAMMPTFFGRVEILETLCHLVGEPKFFETTFLEVTNDTAADVRFVVAEVDFAVRSDYRGNILDITLGVRAQRHGEMLEIVFVFIDDAKA
jgi:hypothetical protein